MVSNTTVMPRFCIFNAAWYTFAVRSKKKHFLYLNEEKGLEEEVEEHVCYNLAYTWERLSFASGDFEGQIGNVLRDGEIITLLS